MRTVGEAIERTLEDRAPIVQWAVEEVARDFGVDPAYLAFLLRRPSSGWPTLAREDERLLRAAMRLLVSFGSSTDTDDMMMLGSDERRNVDESIRRLARWARTKLAPELKQDYLDVLVMHAGQVPLPADDIADLRDRTLVLMERYEEWLRADCDLPRRRSTASILDLLFD